MNPNRCRGCKEELAPATAKVDIDRLVAEHVAAGECPFRDDLRLARRLGMSQY